MSEIKNKFLEKYVSDSITMKEPKKEKFLLVNKKYKNLAIYDELDSNFNYQNEQEIENIKDAQSLQEKMIWKEICEDENEDEIAAIKIAEKENRAYLISKDLSTSNEDLTNLNKKRERHDSDSEEENGDFDINEDNREDSSKSSTEREFDELLRDEDGDIILDNKKENKTKLKSKDLVIELKPKNKINSVETEGIKLKQQTIYRDEFGRKIEKSQTKEARKKALEKLNYQELKQWAMGFIQKEEKKREKEEFNKRKDEPLTKYDIDKEVEDELKKKQRFGDPMKNLLFNKNFKKDEDDIKINIRGFYLPKCKFVGTINRFGIEPGYRWDGVDRSTGFEKRYIESQNAKKAREQEYHKLRTEEM